MTEQTQETEQVEAQPEEQADDHGAAAAEKQAKEDAAQREKDPNAIVQRAANPDVGGESF